MPVKLLAQRGISRGFIMSSDSKPLITIVGALSKQGRSAAHTLLQSGRYRVRALTRRVDAPEAQNLARRGAELLTVPLEDQDSGTVGSFRAHHKIYNSVKILDCKLYTGD
jgi:NmrA-like family